MTEKKLTLKQIHNTFHTTISKYHKIKFYKAIEELPPEIQRWAAKNCYFICSEFLSRYIIKNKKVSYNNILVLNDGLFRYTPHPGETLEEIAILIAYAYLGDEKGDKNCFVTTEHCLKNKRECHPAINELIKKWVGKQVDKYISEYENHSYKRVKDPYKRIEKYEKDLGRIDKSLQKKCDWYYDYNKLSFMECNWNWYYDKKWIWSAQK